MLNVMLRYVTLRTSSYLDKIRYVTLSAQCESAFYVTLRYASCLTFRYVTLAV